MNCRFARIASASLVFSAAALAIGGDNVVNAGSNEKVPLVKVTATATKPDAEGRQLVTITMDIKEGFYTFANPVGDADLEFVQTNVKITSANALLEVNVKYPQGTKQEVGRFVTFYKFEGKVEIHANVKRAPGDAGPLEITVRYMPANGITCHLPEKVTLQVK